MKLMTLYDGKVGGQFRIVGIRLEQFQLTRRLEALGINEMTVVQKLNAKRKGACIIKVRGTRLAIGKHIAQGIEVVSEEEK